VNNNHYCSTQQTRGVWLWRCAREQRHHRFAYHAKRPRLFAIAFVACVMGFGVAVGTAAEESAPTTGIDDDTIPRQLSMADAERVFLARGLDLLIAEFGVRGAEGDLVAAGAHPNPNLALTGNLALKTRHDLLYDTGSNSPADVYGVGATISDNAAIEDQLSGKRSLRIEAAAKALVAARLNIEDVRRLELAQLRQAYAAAVVAELNLQAARESFETYDKQLKLNEARYKNGAINGLELSRVLQAQLESQQAIDSAESGLKQATASLLFLLGARHVVPDVTLTSTIDYADVPQLVNATLDSLHERALQNRSDVKIAAANLEQTQTLLRQAKRSRLPDVQLQFGYSELCNSVACSSIPGFFAGLQGNVPLLYQQQGEIRRTESNVFAAERGLYKTKTQVLSDVTQAFAGYDAAKSQVQRMKSRLLEQAKRSRDLAQVMYQKGAASLIDFMDAQRAYVAAVVEYHQDLANYWNAVYQLEQATGTSLR